MAKDILTPIQTYRSPDQDAAVHLVGMIHSAQPAYYEHVSEILADHQSEGAVIHCEGIRDTLFSLLTLQGTPDAETAFNLLDFIRLSRRIFDGLGLVDQEVFLHSQPGWINNDASLRQVAMMLDGDEMADNVAKLKETYECTREDEPLFRKLGIYKTLAKLSLVEGQDEPTPSSVKDVVAIPLIPSNTFEDVIVDYRNQVALDGVDRQFEKGIGGDAVLVWGAAHLSGFDEGLEQRGFELVEESKIVAIDGNSFFFGED